MRNMINLRNESASHDDRVDESDESKMNRVSVCVCLSVCVCVCVCVRIGLGFPRR